MQQNSNYFSALQFNSQILSFSHICLAQGYETRKQASQIDYGVIPLGLVFISWSFLWWVPTFSVKWRCVLKSAMCKAAVRVVSEKWRLPVRSTQRLLLSNRNLHYINGLWETCKQLHLTATWFWGTFFLFSYFPALWTAHSAPFLLVWLKGIGMETERQGDRERERECSTFSSLSVILQVTPLLMDT